MLIALALATVVQSTVFTDDFEGSLAKWDLTQPDYVSIVEAGDPAQGMALRLGVGGPEVYALMKGSDAWGSVRMDGMVMFPEDVHNYLGFIWGYLPKDNRTDFGSAYIKGNGSYIRVNPRYDGNPGRAYHEDYRTPLAGVDEVVIGKWQPFRIEVVGTTAHLYFGDMSVPKVTYDQYVGEPGLIGFKPRVIGGDVLIDDISVRHIQGFTYQGPPLPDLTHNPDGSIITDWQVLGPTAGLHPDLTRALDPTSVSVHEDGRELTWRTFRTDDRGAVVTARVVEFRGNRDRAYFATQIDIDEPGDYTLTVSSVDDLAFWIDGVFQGYLNRDRFAWYDFMVNDEHAGRSLPLTLDAGPHSLLIEVRGALYAGGAFFAGFKAN